MSPFTFTIFCSLPYIPPTHSHSHFIIELIYKSMTHVPLIFSNSLFITFIKICVGSNGDELLRMETVIEKGRMKKVKRKKNDWERGDAPMYCRMRELCFFLFLFSNTVYMYIFYICMWAGSITRKQHYHFRLFYL